MVDYRVADLWQRLLSYAKKDSMPIVEFRDEILALHEIVTDEKSRVALLCAFNIICDLMACYLEDTGGDLEAFAAHRRGQIYLFLRAECLVDGVLNGRRLQDVTKREIEAGRMTEDEPIRRYAMGDDTALDLPEGTVH
ncbi:MAG: hypothetical protein JWR80_542 [Bradyrhizobium sp.]|nr:hypothetical protein [Bradyrhizobium sp.]